jgi:hypothetical protein
LRLKIVLRNADRTKGAGSYAFGAPLADRGYSHRETVRLLLLNQFGRANRRRDARSFVALVRAAFMVIKNEHSVRHLFKPLFIITF